MRRDLVEGYLYEVTKSLPRRDRKNVYERLQTEIYDEIDRTKAQNVETKEEVLTVLEGYGNPADVAAKYSTARSRGLVPQPHYGHYAKDKWLAFIIGLIVIGALYAFNYFVLGTFPITVETIVEALAKAGILFLVVYITYTLGYSWVSGSRLPSWNRFAKHLKSEPSKSSKVGAFEITFQVILSAILFAAFGLGANLLGLDFGDLTVNGFVLPILALFIIGFFINVINIAYKEIDRRYTFGVMSTTLLTNLAVIGLAFLIFVQNDAISQNFRNWLSGILPNNDLMANIINNIGLVVFLVIALFAVIDTISTALGYHSNNKDAVEPIFKEDREFDDVYVTSDEFKDDSYHNITDTPIDEINDTVLVEDREVYETTEPVTEETYEETVVVHETPVVDEVQNDEIIENRNYDDTIILEENDIIAENKEYVETDYTTAHRDDHIHVDHNYNADSEIIRENPEYVEKLEESNKKEHVVEEPIILEDNTNDTLTDEEVILVDESNTVIDNANDSVKTDEEILYAESDTVLNDNDDEFITQKIDRSEIHSELNKHREVTEDGDIIVVEDTTDNHKL